MFQLIDLTHPLDPSIPTWDGGCGFRFHIEMDYSEGCLVKRYDCLAGAGTHMDAPSHFFPEGSDIASLKLEHLVAPVSVIDITNQVHPDYFLSPEDVESYEQKHGRIEKGSFVFAYTGWAQYWNEPDRYRNLDESRKMHFPGFSPEAAQLLLEREIVGIGLDTLSPDGGKPDFPVHQSILGAGKTIIENLTSLEKLPEKGAYVFALPPKIVEGAETPLRVIGVLLSQSSMQK